MTLDLYLEEEEIEMGVFDYLSPFLTIFLVIIFN